jgi:hypothetical protein
MSIIVCDDCTRYVDTDFYPAAYYEKDNKFRCESCREEREKLNPEETSE